MIRIERFLNPNRKGVKNMRRILTLMLCALFAVSTCGVSLANETATLTLSTVVSSTSSISLSPSTVEILNVNANATTFRFRQTGVVLVSYFAAGSYEIHVNTDNNYDEETDAEENRGYIQTTTGDKLYPKIWCPNFSGNGFIADATGPVFSTTSSQTQYLWGGYDLDQDGNFDANNPEVFTSGTFSEATLGVDINGNGDILDDITATTKNKISEGPSFVYLKERDGVDWDIADEVKATKCVLTWNSPNRAVGVPGGDNYVPADASLNNPFPVVFAIDVNGVSGGSYSSANNLNPGVFFDLVIE